MAIDRTGISSLQSGAPEIKYTGDEGPKSPDQERQMAFDDTPGFELRSLEELLDEFRQDNNGRDPVSIDDLRRHFYMKYGPQGIAKIDKAVQQQTQMQEGRERMQMASAADPMLEEQYQQYVFEMQEQGLQPMSIEEFRQQAVAGMADGGRIGYDMGGDVENKFMELVAELREQGYTQQEAIDEAKIRLGMATGGRVGFKYGGGPDFMNTHKPRPRGNPAVMEEVEDAREFRIANPNIEDIADYKSYYERIKQLEQLMKNLRSQPMAYGGLTNPTYSQRRKQRMAYGGIAGVDGRKRYGIGSWFQKAKDKVVDDIIPNEIKENPLLSSIAAGALLNQFGIPFTGEPGDRMGQDWLGGLLSKGMPGDTQFNTVLGDNIPFTGITSNIDKANNVLSSVNKAGNVLTGGGINPADPSTWEQLNKMVNDPTGALKDAALKQFSTLTQAQNPDDRNILQKGYDAVTGFFEPSTYGTPGNETTVNWKAPLAAGLSLGALDAATRKDETLPDQPGIDIPAIRAAALQGQGGAFLPPASATTAYANGGRTGYYAGNMVAQKRNIFSSFSDYKNRGGTKDFMDWYGDNYLPEMPDMTREKEMPEMIIEPEMIREGEDYTLDNWPYGFAKPGTIGSPDMISIKTYAQGGRIGYATGRNEYLKRLEHLMFLGYDYDSAKEIAQDDDKYQIESTRGLGKAKGGRVEAQEGGLMDLGGMEKDYRNEGGFVPIGGQEKADDVPARLSKNEFVFTADAVRSAGGGDIDKGAEVMENVMEHLEQGGQISQESQGLEGARNMFATAQRLEGVM